MNGAYDPPDWYFPFEHLQAVADELRCSVMEAATTDPEWRRMALTKRQAEFEAARRAERRAERQRHAEQVAGTIGR